MKASSTSPAPDAVPIRSAVWVELATLAGLCAFLFFFGLGSVGLIGADEPRYPQVAREMLARHDWITPVLDGIAWLEKPPLYYWGAMLSYRVLGVTDWASRVPTAAMATALLFAVYLFVRRFRPGSQLDAALIVGSSIGVVGFARAASTDMPLTATFTIAMLAWFTWLEIGKKLWLLVFYAFIALGTLAKGPVAPVLAALIIVVFAGLQKEWSLITRTLWWPGIVLFLGIALPWFVLVQVRNPQFLRVFILQHNLARYSTDAFRHRQPFWYFIPVIILGLLPWSLLAIAGAVRSLRDWLHSQTPEISDLQLFLFLWGLLPVLFFSISQSKLPGYVLPAVPAFGMLAANWIAQQSSAGEKPHFWLLALHSAISGMLLGGVLLVNYSLLHIKPGSLAAWVAGTAAALTFVAIMVSVRVSGVRLLRFVTLLPLVLGLGFVVRYAAPTIDSRLSARPVEREIATIETTRSTLAVFEVSRQLEFGLTFYRNQPVHRYERGEIPAGEHILVALAGSQTRVQERVAGRRVSRIGEYPPQKLEFYWVQAAARSH